MNNWIVIFCLILHCVNTDHVNEGLRMKLKKNEKNYIYATRSRKHRNLDLNFEGKNNTNITNRNVDYEEVPIAVGYGTHYAELYFGKPPQRASVIIDTGSHLTAFPCKNCENCGSHTDASYDMDKSTTSRYIGCHEYEACNQCESDQCIVSQSYTEGSSWRAIMVEEYCWIGDFKATDSENQMKKYGVRFPIGCQTQETGLFITQKENGIIGMSENKNTIMPYLLKAGRIKRDMFSLCFSDTGGSMVLGGMDPSLHKEPIQFIEYFNSRDWYAILIKDILINNRSIGVEPSLYNSGRGIIVDSGTTDTYLPSVVFNKFQSLFSSISGYTYPSSFSTGLKSAEDAQSLPIITIVLSDRNGNEVALRIPSKQYMTFENDEKYVGNIHFTEGSGGVLGASVMMNFDVVFDRHNKKIGFARSDCGNPHAGDYVDFYPGFYDYRRMTIYLIICFSLGIIFLVIWRRQRKLPRSLKVESSKPSERQVLRTIDSDDEDVSTSCVLHQEIPSPIGRSHSASFEEPYHEEGESAVVV